MAWLHDNESATPGWAGGREPERLLVMRRYHHEGAPRGGSPFRPSNPPLEPQDEAVHLPRAQRDLYHRSRTDGPTTPGDLRSRQEDGARGPGDSFRRHQEAGARRRPRRGGARRSVFRKSALARGHANELCDHPKADRAAARAREHEDDSATSTACRKKKSRYCRTR